MSMKNPLTPGGIERATFQFVAQHLNHCATAVSSPPPNGLGTVKVPKMWDLQMRWVRRGKYGFSVRGS